MRRLLVTFGLFGALLGALAALGHYMLPLGEIGWFAYTPLPRRDLVALTIRPGWSPALALFPAAGLLAGLALAGVLAGTGWRLVRT